MAVLTSVLGQLVERASALQLPPEKDTPLERFRAVWELYQFLIETDGIDIYLALAAAMNKEEPLLSEEDKAEMRKHACSFPEDWDSPLDYMG
jgi:hypothetical protein